MAIINTKPDMNMGIWAEGGNIEIPSDTKIDEGWVVEKPLNEYMNWLQNRQDRMLQYLNQRGIPEWDLRTEYPLNAYVARAGKVYKALSQNTDADPLSNPSIWIVAFVSYEEFFNYAQTLNSITSEDGYLSFYVSKDDPVMTSPSKGVSYNNIANVSGYGFDNETPVVSKNSVEVARFSDEIPLTDISKNVATTEWVQSLIDSIKNTLAPVGSVVVLAGRTIPEGYLECNGNTVSRSEFQNLFSVIGTTYGQGDGATTFNLPDLRGEFIRGLDSGRGVDPSRILGSKQGDAIRNITGHLGVDCNTSSPPEGSFDGAFYDGGANRAGDSGEESGENRRVMFDASRVVPTANENRPRNVAMVYAIKY